MIEQLLPFVLPFENLPHITVEHSEAYIKVYYEKTLAMEISTNSIDTKISTVHFNVRSRLTLEVTSFEDALTHVMMKLVDLYNKRY